MLAYDYSAGSARLDDLPEFPISPHLYVLCDRCATSLRAPRGWILDDRRGATNGLPARHEPAPADPTAEAGIQSPAASEPVAEPEVVEPAQRQLAFGYSA